MKYQAYCVTKEKNIGSETENEKKADDNAEDHRKGTGHEVTVKTINE